MGTDGLDIGILVFGKSRVHHANVHVIHEHFWYMPNPLVMLGYSKTCITG